MQGSLTVTVTDEKGRVVYSYSDWANYATVPDMGVLSYTVKNALQEATDHIGRLTKPCRKD